MQYFTIARFQYQSMSSSSSNGRCSNIEPKSSSRRGDNSPAPPNKKQKYTSTSYRSKLQYQLFEPPSLCERLSYLLIRPPKLRYDTGLLELTRQQKIQFSHQVFKIPFELSVYLPMGGVEYVILYLHGNSSNRLEGMAMLKRLPERVGIACFDFEGCGNRNGQWITLGIKQSKEVDAAAKHLKGLGLKVVGWGRSMGAVSLLLSSEIDVMIVDSPFQSIKRVAREFGKSIPYVPYCLYCCLFPMLFCCVNCDIQKKIQCEFTSRLEVYKRVASIPEHKSIMFLCAIQDEMINADHSKKLYENFKGKNKEILEFQGSHNSIRPDQVHDRVLEFVAKVLGVNTQAAMSNSVRQMSPRSQRVALEMQLDLNSNLNSINKQEESAVNLTAK